MALTSGLQQHRGHAHACRHTCAHIQTCTYAHSTYRKNEGKKAQETGGRSCRLRQRSQDSGESSWWMLTPLSIVCVWHSVPSAAGMLLVMHRLLLLRHQSSLQTSCRMEETSQAHCHPQTCLGGPSTFLGPNDFPFGIMA